MRELVREGFISEEALEFIHIIVTAEMTAAVVGLAASEKEKTMEHIKNTYNNKILVKLLMNSRNYYTDYIVDKEVSEDELSQVIIDNMVGDYRLISFDEENELKFIKKATEAYLRWNSIGTVKIAEMTVADSVEFVIVQSKYPKQGVKITDIFELSYDYELYQIDAKPIYSYNFETGKWQLRNKISEGAMHKLLKRGFTHEQLEKWI